MRFLSTQAKDPLPYYEHSQIGYNYRISNVVEGIGRGQLEVLESHIKNRRGMHDFYREIFVNNQQVQLFKEPTTHFFSNHWLSAIVLESYKIREALRLHLEKENIESRPLWKPMHLQPIFIKSPYYGSKTSEDLFERGLCLPSGSNLTNDDSDRIKESVSNFFNNLLA